MIVNLEINENLQWAQIKRNQQLSFPKTGSNIFKVIVQWNERKDGHRYSI